MYTHRRNFQGCSMCAHRRNFQGCSMCAHRRNFQGCSMCAHRRNFQGCSMCPHRRNFQGCSMCAHRRNFQGCSMCAHRRNFKGSSICTRRWKSRCARLEQTADRAQHSADTASARNEQLIRDAEAMRAQLGAANQQVRTLSAANNGSVRFILPLIWNCFRIGKKIQDSCNSSHSGLIWAIPLCRTEGLFWNCNG